MTGEKCYTIKIVSHQNCAKKREKNRKQTTKEKQKNQRKKKMRQNENKAKNVSKKFVKVTMKRKDLYNLSNLEMRF